MAEKCIICQKNDGVETIQDATQYPEKYNGQPVCKECAEDRKIMRETK